jgi:hypothetical protein
MNGIAREWQVTLWLSKRCTNHTISAIIFTTHVNKLYMYVHITLRVLGRPGRDYIVLGFTITCAISAYHRPRHMRKLWHMRNMAMSSGTGLKLFLKTARCNKVCQWLAAGRWFSPGTPVSSTNKTYRHDVTEILNYHKPNQSIYSLIIL